MSDLRNPQPLTTGKLIALQLDDIQKRLQALETAARVLSTPITPGGEGFIPSVLDMLATMTRAIDKQQRSIAALHEAMMEPGIVRALQRAVREP